MWLSEDDPRAPVIKPCVNGLPSPQSIRALKPFVSVIGVAEPLARVSSVATWTSTSGTPSVAVIGGPTRNGVRTSKNAGIEMLAPLASETSIDPLKSPPRWKMWAPLTVRMPLTRVMSPARSGGAVSQSIVAR